jgi:colicin import membrane protein
MRVRALLLMLAMAAAAPTRADTGRDRIQAQRAQADASLAVKERGCAVRFMVAGCLGAARSEHRAALAQLREKTLAIDDARRRALAAARSKVIADKAATQVDRPVDLEPQVKYRNRRGPRVVNGETHRDTAADPAGTDTSASRVAAPETPALPARSSFERRHQAQFDARQRAAQSHRDEVESRNATRRAQGKAVAPLPSPLASAPG